MLNKQNLLVGFVFIVTLLSINFYQAKFASNDSIRYLRVGVLAISIVASLPFFFAKKVGLTPYIQIIGISIVISILMSYYSWGQSYIDSLKITIPVMLWFFYFFLLKFKVSIKHIEKIAFFYGVVYMLLFFFQYMNPQTVYLGFREEFQEDRGIIRIIFSGSGLFNLAIFIALNRFTQSSNKKHLWLIVLILGIVITIMQVTRQAIAAVLVIIIYHFLRDQSFIKKIITGGLLMIASVLFVTTDNAFINKLFNQKNEGNSITKNIRLNAADYFLFNYSPSNVNKILGNGMPYGEGTSYGLFELRLVQKGYYYSDIGIVAFYTFFGAFALIALLILYFKCLTIKVHKDYMYLKYYVFYLIVTIFTSDSCFNYGFLAANIFVFYCLQYIYLQNKEGIRVTITTTFNK